MPEERVKNLQRRMLLKISILAVEAIERAAIKVPVSVVGVL
jgi:hypothetical protein